MPCDIRLFDFNDNIVCVVISLLFFTRYRSDTLSVQIIVSFSLAEIPICFFAFYFCRTPQLFFCRQITETKTKLLDATRTIDLCDICVNEVVWKKYIFLCVVRENLLLPLGTVGIFYTHAIDWSPQKRAHPL